MTRTMLFALAFTLLAAGILIMVTAAARNLHTSVPSDRSTGRDFVASGDRKRVEAKENGAGAYGQVFDAAGNPIEPLTDFQLTDQLSKPFGSKDLKGKVNVVSFFFASCPTSCLKMNMALADVEKDLAPMGVQFVSITCDPENDTPVALNQYARKLNVERKDWKFLTGNLDYIKRVSAEMYLVPLDKGTHVQYFLVFDKWGKNRGKFVWDNPAQMAQMRRTLQALVKEEAPPPSTPSALEPENTEATSDAAPNSTAG